MKDEELPIKHPFQFSEFGGFYVCNGCGERSDSTNGKRGYDIHPEFGYAMVPEEFPHLAGCKVAKEEE